MGSSAKTAGSLRNPETRRTPSFVEVYTRVQGVQSRVERPLRPAAEGHGQGNQIKQIENKDESSIGAVNLGNG